MKKTDNTSIRIYVNKIENRITFTIKARYSLELLTHETMKLFSSAKSKITKNENDVNGPHLEITEAVLVLLILLTEIISKIQEFYIYFLLINHLVNYQMFYSEILYFQKPFDSEFLYIEVWFTIQNLNC